MYWYSFLLTQLLKERFEFARSFNMTAENISLYTVCLIMQYVTEQNLHDVVHVLTQAVVFVYSTSTKYCSLSE